MSHQDVWIIAEQSQGKIKEVSYEILTRGRKLADKLGVELASILLGYNIRFIFSNQVYQDVAIVFYNKVF